MASNDIQQQPDQAREDQILLPKQGAQEVQEPQIQQSKQNQKTQSEL